MKRLLLIVLLAAGCSSDPESSTPTPTPTTTGTQDMGSTSSDVGQSDVGGTADLGNGGDEDLGSPVDMSGSTDDAGGQVDMAGMDLYVGSGDPYAPGSLTTAEFEVAEGDSGAPNDVVFFAPTEPGLYPLVAFQHGFLLRNTYYRDLLTHVASHGFVVVAPQMYQPSFANAPSTADEATQAAALWDWAKLNAASVTGVSIAAGRFGLAGHSRGAKAVWLALEGGYTDALAAAGVDPVDGTGGPLGGEARVLDGGLSSSLPALFIGAALSRETVFGMACAPAGDDHEAFYAGSGSPTWWAFAEDYGHLDMLDDNPEGCSFACSTCEEGPADGGMRTFTGGQLVAFFRGQLQGDATAEPFLRGQPQPPISAQFQNK